MVEKSKEHDRHREGRAKIERIELEDQLDRELRRS
jgi:hypothetical protein